MQKPQLTHFDLSIDADNIAWLLINRADEKVNILNQAMLQELQRVLQYLAAETDLKGLVLRSAKPTGFIFGADVKQFTALKSVEEAQQLIATGQDTFKALAAFPKPTVAIIEGYALGGGLECILACRARIALDDPRTQLGLPEVRLGILPGWGGTVRLPQLIGPLAAMDLMLTGRMLSSRAALKVGLVDRALPLRHLIAAAKDLIMNPPSRRQRLTHRLVSLPIVRRFIGQWITKQTAAKAKPEHYPAPFRIIDNWVKFGARGESAFKAELAGISELFFTDAAKNLIRLFFLTERLKSLGKGSDFKASHVHVIGAGTMGGDIAAWCALQGCNVTVEDTRYDNIAKTIQRAYKQVADKLKKPHLIQQVMDRLTPDVKGYGVKLADVIIEAIFEDENAKQQVFKRVEAEAKPTAILATNTSSIPLADIAKVLREPNRLIGIHFFNPVFKMQLIEVVGDTQTQQTYLLQAYAFVKQISKVPLPVKSTPGFLINRILMPYLMESVSMMSEGMSPSLIDQAALDFGMPMGPVELADTVGLDVCLAVGEELAAKLGGSVPDLLRDKVKKGELGRKTQHGFYHYNKKGKPIKEYVALEDRAQLTHRLLFRMLNEAAACLDEGVVDDADLIDIGMILGTGFAPFTGGPMCYSRQLGKETLQGLFANVNFKPHQAITKIFAKRTEFDDASNAAEIK